MTDYQKMYQEKLTTPDKIAQQVQSGWLLGMDTATSQTPAIMTAIAERIRNSDITGVKVQALLDAYPFEFYTDPTLAGKMTGYSWFSSSAARKAVNAGYADIIPAYYRDFPTRIRTEYDYDAVCVEVAPMSVIIDNQSAYHGYFSLALNGSYIDAMLDKTKRIFLEVNDRQPRGLCGSLIHISQVDAIVEYNHDLPVLPPVQLDEVSKTIGGLIAERIPDGACLQLGIGAIPDATGMALKAKHPHLPLGRFIMLTDGIVVVLGGIIFRDFDGIVYGMMIDLIFAVIADKIMYGANAGKLALIVTDHGEAVTERIDELCGRGTTIIDARGGFRKDHRDVVLCACSGKEMFTITREVKLLDPASFTIILESNEVHGEGFRMLRVAEPHAGDEK